MLLRVTQCVEAENTKQFEKQFEQKSGRIYYYTCGHYINSLVLLMLYCTVYVQCVYMYVCMCVCVCVYIYIYIYKVVQI